MSEKRTKGKAEAEAFPGTDKDPTWIVKIGGKVRFRTLGEDDEANAIEMARRWNRGEECK